MVRKSKVDEDCEELSVVADPWNLKLKPAKLKDVLFPLPVIVPNEVLCLHVHARAFSPKIKRSVKYA
ncbi:MAG: hypothetical protein BA871_03540 [Desulfuromonadales bacterium C00003096]|nr:MAG: hypothetical protein BA871_03540 [Desulfuromonadales bacterium C00003096]